MLQNRSPGAKAHPDTPSLRGAKALLFHPEDEASYLLEALGAASNKTFTCGSRKSSATSHAADATVEERPF
jgi:hypothetical protein